MTDEPEPTTPPIRPAGSRMDEERTPPYPQPAPIQLSRSEVKRIEQIIGRTPNSTHHALVERYRAEGADPMVTLALIALDVHDMKKPISYAVRAAIAVVASSAAIIVFVAVAASRYTETNTAFEYRIRACEAGRIDDHAKLDRLESLLRFPVASSPPQSSTKEPVP